MSPTSFSAAIRSVKGRDGNAAPPLKLHSLVWRSALLNLVIALTALPVMVFAGGPGAVVPALAVMAAVSALIWVATLTAFFLVSIARMFWRLGVLGFQHPHGRSKSNGGLADEWIDGPG
jgi:hypothetical protein